MIALPVLLSRVLGRLTAELEAQPADGPMCSLAVWANVLRVVDGGSERDLAAAARISRRLAVAAVTGSDRRGWVTATKSTRGRDVALTDAGRATSEVWQQRIAALDASWSGSPLYAALWALVRQLPYELAHFPAAYGTADPSAIGGPFVRGVPKDGLPAHGQDWHWVLRAGPTDLSITALLAHVLTAFAIDYEATPMWPLASTTLVVQHLSTTPKPLADLPQGHGITGKGTSLLERHGLVDVQDRRARLTSYGKQVKDHHGPYLAAVEISWRERYGDARVTTLHTTLAADPAAADVSLPDHVLAPLHVG